jgi:hypothetical protein
VWALLRYHACIALGLALAAGLSAGYFELMRVLGERSWMSHGGAWRWSHLASGVLVALIVVGVLGLTCRALVRWAQNGLRRVIDPTGHLRERY